MPAAQTTAEPFVPDTTDLEALASAAQGCRGCELYANATQAVFGEGVSGARVMLVGEQPGDKEDLKGEPFVGPAGRVLDEGLERAGIDRSAAYVTNAVKHFRWKSTDTGPRRIHQNPSTRHVVACEPWLTSELRAVGPQVIVALGATAGQALFGAQFRVTKDRGRITPWPPDKGPYAGNPVAVPRGALGTIHPSAVLRTQTPEERQAALEGLIADLRIVADALN